MRAADSLDTEDPRQIARVVAEGALAPLEASARFELAVVVRLLQALAAVVEEREPGRWEVRRTLVMPGRRELAELRRDDGARVCLYYNQAILDPGPCDVGAKHYLGQTGRLRPDATVIAWSQAGEKRACVIEVKLSADPGYILSGFHEAQLYCAEYRTQLGGWPQAILVSSEAVAGPPRRSDDVVAVGWNRWVPRDVAEGLIDAL